MSQQPETLAQIAERNLKAYIKGTLELSKNELDETIKDVSRDPIRLVQFIYSMGDRLTATPMLQQEDKEKLYLACCKLPSSAFWLIRMFPNTQYREKAFKVVLRDPTTAMTFRTDHMFVNDTEKWQATKSASRALQNIISLIKNNDSDFKLDEKEIEMIATNIIKSREVRIARSWHDGTYGSHCPLPEKQKDRLLALIMSDKLSRRE